MKENIFKEMVLDNGQKLVIYDLSRKIGADAYVVIMQAAIVIKVEESLFSSEDLKGISFGDIAKCLGPEVSYIYKTERNMIFDREKDDVFESLVQAFLDNLGQYLSKPTFPKKFIIKAYGDKVN